MIADALPIAGRSVDLRGRFHCRPSRK